MKLARRIKQSIVFLSIAIVTNITVANPVLNNVSSGDASVSQSNNLTEVNQTSQQAILNWHSFNIDKGEVTHFQQPAGGVALNRIDPHQGASQIFGTLSATGKIILVNQAGIYFGPESVVDVGGIIASTSNISDQNFLNGKYIFDQPSPYSGSIVNQGMIIAKENGLVALVGASVSNEGLIKANYGEIVLASGKKFTVDLSGDQLVNFTVDEGLNKNDVGVSTGVSNKGALIANGGTIILSAKSASGVLDQAINMEGVAVAHSVSQQNGEIILDGGDGNVTVAANLDVSGKEQNAKGGTVKILGGQIHVKQPSVIDASGNAGGGNILIGGNYHGKGPEQNAYLTQVDPGVAINANAILNGNGGNVVVWSDLATAFSGNISALGGISGGNGGFVETSSGKYLDINGSSIDLRAPMGTTGTWLLDPENLTIQTTGPTTASFASNTYTGNLDNSILTVADLEAALGSASIVVETGAGGAQSGDITVAAPIYWGNGNSLTLNAYNNVIINANASIRNSSTGSLNINADTGLQNTGTIQINGDIALAGGTLTLSAPNIVNSITNPTGSINVNNFILSSGQWTQTDVSNPSFSVTNDFELANGTTFIRNMGTTTIGGDTYNLIADVYGLQGIATQDLTTNFALSQDIDASKTINWNGGAGFQPIASDSTSYTGKFDGQNHVIDGLYINRPTLDAVSFLVTVNNTTISNIGLTNINYTGAGTDPNNLGGLIGNLFNSTLSNAFVTGTLTQAPGADCNNGCSVGGLVGGAVNSTIQNSYNGATVIGTSPLSIGGLVGYVDSGSNIISSYNSGSITGSQAGGLVGGLGNGNITDSYNIGSVTGTNASWEVGGLVAEANYGTITNTYSSGAVSGPGIVGGFLGRDGGFGGLTISNSYWDSSTSNTSSGVGSGAAASGAPSELSLTNSLVPNPLIQSSYAGFDFTNTWFNLSYGSSTNSAFTRPMLRSEFSTTIRNAHQVQLIGMDGSQAFTLANDIDLGSAVLNKADVWGTDLSSGNGFLSVGTFLPDSSSFTGSLNGNGHVIDGLYINWNTNTAPPNTAPSLFALINGGTTVENIGLTNVSVTASVNNGGPSPYAFWMGGTLQNAYATGTVTATGLAQQVIPGGLVSGVIGGTINNSYTTVNVTASGSGQFEVGGLAGRVRNDINGTSTISNSYSTGSVTSPAGDVGGFVGQDSGATIYSNNFWDKTTSTQSNGVDNGNNANVTGETTSQMMTKSTFTNAGWDFGNNTGSAWGIIDGNTYPFLQVINTGISGTATGLTSGTAQIVVNGANLSTPTINGSGFFYTVARTTSVPVNSAILVYLPSGGKSNDVTVQVNSGNSISGLVLNPNKITIGDTVSKTVDNSAISQAEGNLFLTNNNIIYSSAGPILVLGNATANTITLNNTASNNYNIDGAISEASGVTSNYVFDGTVSLSNNPVLAPTGTQIYNGAVTLASDATLQGGAATFNSTVDGANNLTLSTNTTINGNIGQITPLTSITANNLVALNTGAISTTGNQTYNANVTLGTSTVTASTVSGNIAFNGNVTGSGDSLVLTGTGNNNFTLTNALTLDGLGIIGGTGTNTLTFQTNSASQLWDILNSNSGLVTITGLTNPSNFINIQNLVGGNNTDIFTLDSGGTLSGSINGGGGSNTIVGDNVLNTWTLTGSNSGTATGIGTGFSNIQNLTGGSNVDFFTLNGGTISGAINGGGNDNIITADNVANTFNITGTNSGNVTGVGSFSNIDTLIGGTLTNSFIVNGGTLSSGISGGGGTSTLTADNVPNTWSIFASNIGSVTGIANFNQIQNLVGGSNTDSFTLNGGTISGSINGGGGSNTLTADNVANSWNITSANAGTVTGVGSGFSNIQNLVGNSNVDSFTLNGGTITGSINGAGGQNTITADNVVNTFNITGANSGNMTGVASFSNIDVLLGGTVTNSFILSGGSITTGIAGGLSGTSTLTADNVANTWTIVGPDAGSVTGIASFGRIQNLVGGSSTDNFILSGGTVSGSINGGSGSNTITGDNVSNTWNITGSNAGTITGVSGGFTNIQNLTGGTNADYYTFQVGGSISGAVNGGGGSGANTIDLSLLGSPTSVALSGTGSSRGFAGTSTLSIGTTFNNIDTFNGPAGLNNSLTGANIANTWTIVGTGFGSITSTNTLNYSDFKNLIGGSNSDNFILNGGTVTGSINGGSGSNTLTGDNVSNSWNITGSNSGTVTGVTSGFSNIQNLVGGNGTDNFVFANGQTISGNLNGGTGTNTLDLSAYTSAVSLNLQAATVTGVGGTVSNVSNFIGGSGSNTITGANGTHSWNITANNGGNIDSATNFTSFGNLVGGTGNDNFIISNGKSVSGNINGGSGTNTLDLSAYLTTVSVSLPTATVTGVGGTFSNLNNFIGNSANSNANTLTASSGGTHTWSITANNSGTLDGATTFTNFGTLVGGSSDTLALGNGISLNSLSMTAGTLDYSAYSTPVSIDLSTNSVTGIGSLSGATSFIGGSGNNTVTNTTGNNTWTISNNNTGNVAGKNFSAFGNIVGGAGDSFVLGSNGAITGNLSGTNATLNVSAMSSPTVNLSTNTSSGIGGTFSGVNTFIGSGNNSVLIGPAADSTWSISSANGGTIGSNTFSAFGNLTGGAGANNFVLNTGGSIGGALTGGGGNNTLTIASGTTSWNISGANSGSVTSRVGSFSNIQNLTGGTGDSTFFFSGNGSVSGLIDGGNSTATSNNLVDFSGFGQQIILTLSQPVNNEFNAGTLSLMNNSGANIGSFTQVQGVVGTNLGPTSLSTIIVPNIANITITYSNPAQTAGSIADPFSFTNMSVQYTPPPAPPTPSTPSDIPNTNVIVQSTTPNIVNQNNMDIIFSGLDSINSGTSFSVNTVIDNLITQQDELIQEQNNQTTFGCL